MFDLSIVSCFFVGLVVFFFGCIYDVTVLLTISNPVDSDGGSCRVERKGSTSARERWHRWDARIISPLIFSLFPQHQMNKKINKQHISKLV